MRKFLHPLMALLVVATLASPTLALQQEGGGASGKSQAVTVTITKVDSSSGTVSVATSDGQTGTFTVDSATKITVGGKKGNISDLKDGQTARLRFQGTKAVSIDA